ncbi:MAG: transcription elongation factor GreA [Defluviitaleaceae bacterium]|nr:transcription elongation factor GreA [Defluviitaleaceae bacterium]
MNMEKKYVLTYEGIKELEDELKLLKGTKRKDVAQKIKEARAQGDLSENAEYDAAKDEQAHIEGRIALVETMLRNAEVIDEEEAAGDVVSIGNTVTLFDEEFQEEIVYQIVGSAEANPEKNRISNESPLGLGLLGQKLDDLVSIEAPAGIMKYKILAIS